MKRLLSLVIGTAAATAAVNAQYAEERDACTSIMVASKASADGSVMTSHTCDSWYRTWMQMAPAAQHADTARYRVWQDRMHTEYPGTAGLAVRGTIDQVPSTYAYLDVAYPCLNEKQLAIGETTYSGLDTMRNPKGMFVIEELMRISLERCTTAREAIRLMGDLIKKHGYGDTGECLTIADPKEVWIFEVQGEGPDRIGGVWAAARIPDDAIAVSANVSRIGEIDFNDKDRFMWSDNVRDVARRMGLWDGKQPFSFWRAYSGGNYLKEPKNYSVRELHIMQAVAPSAGLNADMEELPLWVVPERKLSVADVSALLGSYYEGTDLHLGGRLKVKNPDKKTEADAALPDSIVSPRSNPWMRPDEIAVYEAMGDSAMHNIRTVSVSWCAYSTVIQCRSWLPDAVGGVAWVALDNPGQSPRFPIFAGTTELPQLLGVCGQYRNRDDAALWRFRRPNRLATVRWGQSRQTMEPARDYFLQKGARELPMVEHQYAAMTAEGRNDEATAMLNGYVSDFFGATVLKWDELADKYWYQHWRGF